MLRVSKLPRGTTEESLENFFANARKFGGGDVKNVVYDESLGSAIITLKRKKVQQVVDKTPRHDTILLIGDLNAKIGDKLEGEDGIVGRHGIQFERSDNGEKFVEFCGLNNFAITTTMFPHKDIHLYTWTTPNGQHKNQIDHVAINGKFKRSINDVKVMRAVDKVLKKMPILFNKKVIEVESYTGVVQPEKQYEHFTENLLEADNKCTIEVTGMNPDTTEDTLMYYFESKRGVNSDVTNIEFVEEKSVFLVTFDVEGAVNKAIEKMHVVEGFTLTIKRHLHPIKYPNKTLIKGLNETTSKDTLINFLEAKTKLDVQDVQYGADDSTKAIATYSKKLDINRLQDTCRAKPLDGNILEVQPVVVTDSIIVRGYNDRTTESTLEYYFSNRKKSGVEDVSEVKMNPEEGYCIITFEDPKDVLQACKKQHKVDSCILQVQVFYESLGLPRCSIGPPLKSPPSIIIDTIDRNKISFILHSLDLKQEIENKLQDHHAIITWPDRTEHMIIKVDCTLTDHKKRIRTQAKTWKDDVRRYIGSVGDRLISEQLTVLQDAWGTVTTSLPHEIISSKDNFSLTTEGPPSCTINVVGYQQSVKDISNKIKAIIDKVLADINRKKQQMQEEVRLKSYQLSILALSNFQDNARKKFRRVDIAIDMEKQSIFFTGTSTEEIHSAKLSMFEITKDVVAVPLGERLESFIQFLKTPEVSMDIKQKIKQANLVGTWEIHGNVITVYAITDEHAVAAASILKESVIETKLMIDHLQISLIDSQKWTQHVQALEDEFKQNTIATKIVTDHQKQIFVYSTSEEEASSIREKIQDFFLLNMEHEKTIPFSPLQLEFMQNQFKDEVDKLKASLKEKNVTISFTSEGIYVKGKQLGLNNAEREIESLQKLLKDNPGFKNLAKQANKGSEGELIGAQSPLLETKTDRRTYTHVTGGQNIIIMKSDITALDVDVIVNAAKNDLDHTGGLAKILVNKGGQCIQTECSRHIKRNGKLCEGEVFCSESGNLKCQLIIHVVGPLYQNGRNREEERLFDCVQSALIETEKRGLQSIAFPALCTGIFGYPVDEATKVIVMSVQKYFLDITKSKIQKVYLCDINDRTVDCFEKAAVDIHKDVDVDVLEKKILDRREQRFSVAKEKRVHHVHVGQIKIVIIKDRLDRIKVDAIVNTTSKDLKLVQGFISSTLAKTAGPSLQRECNMKFPNGIDYGEVAITSGGNLQCKIVCHGALEQWSRDLPVIKDMRTFVINCLYAADKRNLRSIAFPALGTGQLGYPKDDVAQEMYSSIEEFSEKCPRSNITEVFFVLYNKDYPTIKAFQKCERSRLAGIRKHDRQISSLPKAASELEPLFWRHMEED